MIIMTNDNNDDANDADDANNINDNDDDIDDDNDNVNDNDDLVTRHDVDGLVWRLNPEPGLTHVATFPALGYVQVSANQSSV